MNGILCYIQTAKYDYCKMAAKFPSLQVSIWEVCSGFSFLIAFSIARIKTPKLLVFLQWNIRVVKSCMMINIDTRNCSWKFWDRSLDLQNTTSGYKVSIFKLKQLKFALQNPFVISSILIIMGRFLHSSYIHVFISIVFFNL